MSFTSNSAVSRHIESLLSSSFCKNFDITTVCLDHWFILCQKYIWPHIDASLLCLHSADITVSFSVNPDLSWPSLCTVRLPMHDLTCFISLPILIHKTCPDYLSLLSLIISFSFCTAAFSLTSSFQTLRATMSGFSSWCRTFISVFQPPKANSAFQGFHPSGVGK